MALVGLGCVGLFAAVEERLDPSTQAERRTVLGGERLDAEALQVERISLNHK